jgi:hypothetical protein
MDLTEGSEMLEKLVLTPWRHPKEHIQDSEHGENLKSRLLHSVIQPGLEEFVDAVNG